MSAENFKFLFGAEPDLPVDTERLARLVNSHCKHISATSSTLTTVLRYQLLPSRSADFLPHPLREESTRVDARRTMFFTAIPFDDNYFFHKAGRDGLLVVSMSGWNALTNLPMENGALYFALKQALFSLHVPARHYDVTGCIYDFHSDKRSVDAGMRAAFLCADCDKAVRKFATASGHALLKDIIALLDVLSRASRAHESIFRTSDALLSGDSFDVFLCHNSKDKPVVGGLAQEIRERQLNPWLDDEQIPPGQPWQQILSAAIPRIRAAAVIVGPSGIGPWQDLEIQAVLNEFVKRGSPVIPVLLSIGEVQRPELPLFLRNFMWLERDHPEFLARLIWGITGKRPN